MNEVAEELRVEQDAKQNTSRSDLVEFMLDLDDLVHDLLGRLERLEGEVQRLRDDVNYILGKI